MPDQVGLSVGEKRWPAQLWSCFAWLFLWTVAAGGPRVEDRCFRWLGQRKSPRTCAGCGLFHIEITL